jgi:hypothetical protein
VKTPPRTDGAHHAVIMRIAAEATCDPRTVVAELAARRGERAHVRGRSGDRIRAILERIGYAPIGELNGTTRAPSSRASRGAA